MSSASVQCTSTAASPSACEAVEHAQRARRLAGEHGLAEPEDVVAGDVEDRRLDLLEARARRPDGAAPSFWISWCAASRLPSTRSAKKASARCPSAPAATCWPCAARRAAIHGGSALRSTGSTRTRDAGAVERAEPGARLLRAVEARQLDQRDDVAAGAGDGDLAVALQRLRAVLAGLARRDADLDQLPVGEQAQRLRRAEQAAPVEVRAGDGVHLALAAAGRARRGADRVGGFLGEQRLVAPDRVDGARARASGGRRGARRRAACGLIDQTSWTEASRRSTCETMSVCMARYRNASSCSLASAALSV